MRAQHVMEKAVTVYGKAYQFTATYFGSSLGYFIDKINGTGSLPAKSCFWLFYFRRPDGMEIPSPVGVTNYIIPGNGYTIVLRFEQSGRHGGSGSNFNQFQYGTAGDSGRDFLDYEELQPLESNSNK